MKRKAALALAAVAVLIVVILLLVGGDDEASEDDGSTPATTTESPATTTAAEETVDPPAQLPDGWSEVINQRAGFSIGLPPQWTEAPVEGAEGTVLSSPDDLIVISVTADRSAGALELPLEDFARRTAEALGSEIVGSERFQDLEVYGIAPFEHTYDAAAARAQGTPAEGDARERVLVVALRREDFASYVIVVRENDERESDFADRDTVKEVIRSLRGRPPA